MSVSGSDWLEGKRFSLIGKSLAIGVALCQQGAQPAEGDDADILVHVADPPTHRPAHELAHEDWRDTLDAGLDQRFQAAQAFAAARRGAGGAGAILFVGAPEQALGSDHAAAAGALVNLTKTLSVEWARDGIRVNTVLTRSDGATLGNLAAYLVSDYAAYVTGAIMGIDGNDR